MVRDNFLGLEIGFEIKVKCVCLELYYRDQGLSCNVYDNQNFILQTAQNFHHWSFSLVETKYVIKSAVPCIPNGFVNLEIVSMHIDS